MTIRRCWTLASVALAVTVQVEAQSPRDDLVVSAEWVAEHLDDADLVLLQVGSAETYAEEHLPGARHLEFRSITDPNSHDMDGLVLELPDPTELESVLEALGVSDESQIVVYWADQQVTSTTRVIFTLDWAGLGHRVALMDGGLRGWKAAGNAVTTSETEVRRGDLTLRPRAEKVADAGWVQEHAGEDGFAVLDGRAPAFYDGVRGDQGQRGHIPFAGSLHWQDVVELGEDGAYRVKGQSALRDVFEAAGMTDGDTVVAYCHIGQYATAVLLGARALGHEVVLYDGAWQDWAARGLPTETDSSGN